MTTKRKEKFNDVVFKFIDAHVDLYGYINVSVLSELFGIHRTSASGLLARYKELKPSNLEYVLQGTNSRYVKRFSFEKVVLKSESSIFLNSIYLVYEND
ncbi:hypothetical protein UA32_12540 [Photobacterium angustum]|uniref:DNA-binding transcriptional repressor CapW winged helix-turn-helix domain-containing protein n=1 Tax=Photobacterium angustum TaxID=661 RepID=A0ABX5H271_PHOAN|nr:hypothetical protein UA32_12540 [Photobacterium angustum]PSX07043.1 hypothetical protein C0W27_15860 [Photobacterium angustum]